MAQELTAHTFDTVVKNGGKPVVVDFYAEWCGPCQQMAPAFDELSKELAATHALVKINIDDERSLAIAYGITAIPTLVFFKDGVKVASESGYHSKSELLTKIKKHLG